MTEDARKTIERLGLVPLEGEGGFFSFITEYGLGSGSIYYMVTPQSFSRLHLLSSDELWFFLEGDEAEQITVTEDGKIGKKTLSPLSRHSLVKKGVWQSTRIKRVEKGYSLFSTLMSPRYSDEMYSGFEKCPWSDPVLEELK